MKLKLGPPTIEEEAAQQDDAVLDGAQRQVLDALQAAERGKAAAGGGGGAGRAHA